MGTARGVGVGVLTVHHPSVSPVSMADHERTPKPGRYDFTSVERKWQRYWEEQGTFRSLNPGQPGADTSRPKYYILDMFPYPSGAGLHVGHPLGYCATDIVARYKRMKGFNVLHPMGFDAFGLPAEQYAIEHNVHPADTTRANIETYRRQLRMFGFSYDWSREVSTCEPEYYKHTQWIFLQMFDSWFDAAMRWTDPQGKATAGRARPIAELLAEWEAGRWGVSASLELVREPGPDRREWKDLSERERRRAINLQRLAYIDEVPVNWCPALGTVLANEEVDNDGRSERGGHPVYRRPLRQWMLRITKYAERLLADLDELDWPEPIKLMQRNWIGRSVGAEVSFALADAAGLPVGPASGRSGGQRASGPVDEADVIRVFTTRPDTLYGATYMVLAPEHPLVERITTPDQRAAVTEYVRVASNRSDLERTAEAKTKTGVFTGAHAINPVNGARIPIWIADYVLMGYGTGAIMAVPGHDQRDFEFAKTFDLPIVAVVNPTPAWLHRQFAELGPDKAYLQKAGKPELAEAMLNSASDSSGIVGGITAQNARALLDGDASWVNQVLYPAWAADPAIFRESFDGEGESLNSPPTEAATGAARSCDLNGLGTVEAKRKMIEHLEKTGLGRGAVNYKLRDWIFSRQKYWGEPFPVLHSPDGETIGVSEDELPVALPPMANFKPTPAPDNAEALPEPPLGRAKSWTTVSRDGTDWKRDLNTMPQWAGSCWYYLRFIDPHNSGAFCDKAAENYWMPVDLYVGGAEHAVLHLLYARFWHKVLFDLGHVSTREPFQKLFNQGMIQSFAYETPRGLIVGPDKVEEPQPDTFVHKETQESLKRVVAKMSKALKNVVNPDEIIGEFGADTFRLYEMYMGPLDAAKPWNTRDVPGLFKLCQRIWRLVIDEETDALSPALVEDEPDRAALHVLHRTIKKVGEDIEHLKLNTAIAAIFDFVNEMTPLKRRPRKVIEPFVLVIAPFAPHLAEELWQRLGHPGSLALEPWPAYDDALTRKDELELAVQVTGKIKARIVVPAEADDATVEQIALAHPDVQAAVEGRTIKMIKVVKGRLVNIVAT
jgi:leucyl-tRNA synthetase